MTLSIIKFLHLLCGLSFFGIVIASFFYIASSLYKRDKSLIDYSIRASYFGDGIIFLCGSIVFVSAQILVRAGHFSMSIPWIFVAFHAFSLLLVLWFFNLVVKAFYLSKKSIPFYSLCIYYFLNLSMLLIFIIIIHDAVMQSTGFDFLFRK